MTWFFVDDHLHEHRKPRVAGVEAMGLWVLAGSYCADNLTDGFIPERVCARFTRRYRSLAAKLVDAGMWVPTTMDEPGWVFHDWTEINKTREEVQVRRQKRSAAGRLGGKASGRAREATAKHDVEASASTNGVEPPSLPFPSLPKNNARAARMRPDDDPDFDRFWRAYPRRVDPGRARKAWKAALRKTTADVIVAAASSYTSEVRGTEPRFVKHPATWLNAEAWENPNGNGGGAPETPEQRDRRLNPWKYQ